MGQAASDRRPDARPDQDRHGRRHQHLGRRRPRALAGARARSPRTASSSSRSARRISAPARARWSRRRRRYAGPSGERDQAGNRRHDVPDQRRIGREHDGGSGQSGGPHRCGQRARRAQGDGRAGARRGSRPRSSRPADGFKSRTTRRRACRGPTPASSSAPSRFRSTATGSPVSRRSPRRACSSPKSTVDIETGIVKVTRVLAIQDCGLVVSRLTAESQVYGGVIGSLNFALFEDRILDRNTGQMVNPNMEWYLLAGMSDIPKIDVRSGRSAGARASSGSASRRPCRPRRRSPTRCGTPSA